MSRDPQIKKIYQLIKTEQANLKKSVADKMFTLFTSALGLVAALAWNDAIKSLFEKYFPAQEQLLPKIWYALLVTYYLGKFTGKENKPK